MERIESLQSDNQWQMVEFYFRGRNLRTDNQTFVRIYSQETDKEKILKTQISLNGNKNSQFIETFKMKLFFEVRTNLIVDLVYKEQKVATINAYVGQILASRQKGITQDFLTSTKEKIGELNIFCETAPMGSNRIVTFSLRSSNIPVSKTWFCLGEKSVFFRIYKIKKENQYLLYQSQSRKGKDAVFTAMQFYQFKLCNNEINQPIIVRFYQEGIYDNCIAQGKLTLKELKDNRFNYKLQGADKAEIFIINYMETQKYVFTDYLSAGMQMALQICIDFTGSNGIPSAPTSLHYMGHGKDSLYGIALQQVANIVLDYDTDKLVPTYGFGAKVAMPTLNTGNLVHHHFPINGSFENPNLYQLQGIKEGYRKCLPFLAFAGPTKFAPLLDEARQACEAMKLAKKEYMILLILTDGMISDMQDTEDLLVKCNRLPISVIIIGIGNNQDWCLMEKLNDNQCQMRDKEGNKSVRDLVSFVPFSKFNNNSTELARAVLEEVPRQVEDYHRLVNMTPKDYIKNNSDATSYFYERQ